jgi:hypothetical protein
MCWALKLAARNSVSIIPSLWMAWFDAKQYYYFLLAYRLLNCSKAGLTMALKICGPNELFNLFCYFTEETFQPIEDNSNRNNGTIRSPSAQTKLTFKNALII